MIIAVVTLDFRRIEGDGLTGDQISLKNYGGPSAL